MAKVFPDGWRNLAAIGGAKRELQTLASLAEGLNDSYSIYHGVHWTRVEQNNFAIFGEIDFAIVGPTGKLLLIEQKSGLLTETARGLVKIYADTEKPVPFQMARSADALRNRLRQFCGNEATFVDSLLYCPDYVVKTPGSAGIDPARIIDATRKDRLIEIIRSILPETGEVLATKDKVQRFLGEILDLVPNVDGLVGEARSLYTRLSGGLALWARAIECEPFRLRIIGTAGSGKTQLALAVYREAIQKDRRPLYVCYNRPLADHMTSIAPPGGELVTYHQLGDRICHALGTPPDFAQPDVFPQIEAALDHYAPPETGQFDEIIIDEGQDFQERWLTNLMRFLRPGGRAWWLEDPMQNLYGRAPVRPAGWVTLRSDVNYRSPRDILDALNRMLPLEHPVQAGSPLTGSDVEIIAYSDAADLIVKTVEALGNCVRLGFALPHIALITYRGREHSQLAPFDRLGPYCLRAPTGQYDQLGNPVYTEGDLLIDSVHRFKGRAAPCVVFTEIDFAMLDEGAVRRLFVGATRATLKLTLVVSQTSARVLLDRL